MHVNQQQPGPALAETIERLHGEGRSDLTLEEWRAVIDDLMRQMADALAASWEADEVARYKAVARDVARNLSCDLEDLQRWQTSLPAGWGDEAHW